MARSDRAYIVDVVRTPVGKKGGGLSEVHPVDLLARVLRAVVDRNAIDPLKIDDVIIGCTDQIGPQATNIARFGLLAAGLPEEVPGVTIDRQCGSAQQALHFAAQAIMSGTQDVVLVGGVQSMSRVPVGSASSQPFGPHSHPSEADSWIERYGDERFSQFSGAELIAERWSISRRDMEEYALESHRRSIAAVDAGLFDSQILPMAGVTSDEGPRRDTSIGKMSKLQPLRSEGRITAAVSSQISDGAGAALVVSARALEELGLVATASVRHIDVRGDDPRLMLTAPIIATRRALDRAGMTLADIDLFEVNEAFACVPMAWMKELDVDPAIVNVNGGAIALGHPIGASGIRLLGSLIASLEQRDASVGLQVMCEGGGLANVSIIERVL